MFGTIERQVTWKGSKIFKNFYVRDVASKNIFKMCSNVCVISISTVCIGQCKYIN